MKINNSSISIFEAKAANKHGDYIDSKTTQAKDDGKKLCGEEGRKGESSQILSFNIELFCRLYAFTKVKMVLRKSMYSKIG